jgi:hypothetical protein
MIIVAATVLAASLVRLRQSRILLEAHSRQIIACPSRFLLSLTNADKGSIRLHFLHVFVHVVGTSSGVHSFSGRSPVHVAQLIRPLF